MEQLKRAASGPTRITYYRGALLRAAAATLALASAATGVAVAAQSTRADASLAGPPTGAYGAADPLFQEPFIDVDEWRETPGDKPVRFRYIHGGFRNTGLKFSFYMPDKARYQGRFFQYVAPAPGPEDTALKGTGENNRIAFAFDSGGYLVETNMGAPTNDASITGFRASAAAADYSRVVAMKMFGGKRPFGYIYGGSGGGYRTMAAIENTTVWDGAVPYVIGSPRAMQIMVYGHRRAARILKDRLPQIVDAIDAGGSGDMYAGLNKDEADALREATRLGYPPQAWILGSGVSIPPGLLPGTAMDPTYLTDFWTNPGYEGTDPNSYAVRNRVQFATTALGTVTSEDAARLGIAVPQGGMRMFGGGGGAPPPGAPGFRNPVGADLAGPGSNAGPAAPRLVGIALADVPATANLDGAVLRIRSGEAAGKTVPLDGLVKNVAFSGSGAAVLAMLKPGDQVQIDNSDALATDVYLRYQVPSRDYTPWDQYRDGQGRPLPPQRPLQPESSIAGGPVQNGIFKAKVIVVASLVDEMAVPWNAAWYDQKVRARLGSRTDDSFRLWFTENAIHGDGAQPGQPTRIVSYLSVLHQALRDVAAWVEKGTPPPASTRYRVVDNQILVPGTAASRRGIQPVVTLKANGAARADVAAGQPVTFSGLVEVPPGTGKLVAAEWDFEGAGTFPVKGTLVHQSSRRATVSATHSFTKPGTYFGVLRVTSQRQGDADAPWGRIRNLARARVVVK